MLSGKSIVLGVTGGIAAYKACELVSRLKKQGAQVRVVMTANGAKFVAPLSLQTISGNPVNVDTFAERSEMEHISLAKWADMMLIAPVTANVIGKLTAGIADDLLTSVAMAMRVPVMLAPAMNTGMWQNPATVQNVETLKRRGYLFVGPATGLLACGDEDIGRMSEPEEIVQAVHAHFARTRDMAGLSVLVTAGPTVEDIDPVRYIGNRSSGKMGYALAEAALSRGANVSLITGPVALTPPAGAKVVHVRSTMDLYREATEMAALADIVIQAAAPADFTVLSPSDQKIKHTDEALVLTLTPNPDIASALGEKKREGQTLVAFAAETGARIENARGKREKKRADLMVFNDVGAPGAGFDVDTNIVTLIDDGGEEALPILTKREVAHRILDRILSLRK